VRRHNSELLTVLLRSLLLTLLVTPLAFGQTGTAQLNPSPSGASTQQSGVTSNIGGQSPFLGSVPTGKATETAIPLSIRDALERGLKYNLGLIESDVATRTSRAERLRALSNLLPNINASLSQTVEQIDLRAMGINFPGVPAVVGPFGVQDARGFLSQRIFDWNAVENLRASTERQMASQYTYKNSRDIVVLAVGNAYLLVISDVATVDSQQAQLKTSQALYQRAADQRKAGVAAQIDEMRAQVELQTQQQRLIAAQNQLAKDKLSLARIIGLPPAQEFTLTDTVPYAPLVGVTLEKALIDAYIHRADYMSAKAEVHAAELARRAAVAERYPSISTSVNYGDIGPNLATSHGTVTFASTLNIPIFQGGRIKADIMKANAELRQRQAELEDLRGRIDNEVRSAFLDLNSASDLVKVAKSNLDLANETLAQAKDRFIAGVTDNLEVVQAQESVATANQAYITSLYSFNIAKVELAKAAGVAEQAVRDYLGGR
jgi:outer membrane protein TolC